MIFVSDMHFGWADDEKERRRSFLAFLESARGIERLCIVGDLFQFWFDLGRTIPRGFFDVLAALNRLAESGTRVDYLAGNHDYWRGDFFRTEVGIETHAGGLDLELQGRRIRVQHGDGDGPGDWGYKMLKRVVRAPLTIGLARALHPDLLQALARGLGRWSRAHTGRREPDLPRLEAAAHQVFARGYDALVMGHVHAQVHRRIGGGELLVIGDWLDLRSYVRLEAGRFTPERWPA